MALEDRYRAQKKYRSVTSARTKRKKVRLRFDKAFFFLLFQPETLCFLILKKAEREKKGDEIQPAPGNSDESEDGILSQKHSTIKRRGQEKNSSEELFGCF